MPKAKHLLSASLALTLKTLARAFYRIEVDWVGHNRCEDLNKVRLFVFLNHTSLYEPLFVGAFPSSFIWHAAQHIVIPAADKTVDRPIVGLFFKLLIPNLVKITRKRDGTWQEFLDQIHPDSLVAILPEGRMMREEGLDLAGRPMSVKGGVADILQGLEEGELLIAYSGGLHHVQFPGQWTPRLFKTIQINFEMLPIAEFKAQLQTDDPKEFKHKVIKEFERRMAVNTPKPTP